ncbi:Serine protease, subtilisin family [Amycolatopsis xylanica]|uniref:Serine protease, subtilisin family n=1 Tax=Amycolatopsis xylanica TaxID=589385 RepID=A0A1H3GTB4_9PSEU|nr:S8 family serine peptidase [Amycolatopsis xylanica]SDY05579.1 Serine protease, subtilisin family [Amycolatopsis xylanica]
MRRRVMTLSTIAVVIAAGLTLPAAGWADPPVRPPRDPDVITLITGDQVFVTARQDGGTDVEIKAAEGRENVEFAKVSDGGDVLALPMDAAPQVASGRLDKRLFNVTELVREGFAGGPLPVIVAHDGPMAAAVTRELPSIGASAMKADAGLWRGMAAAGVGKVWLDANARLIDDQSNAQIGAPAAWQAGFTGKGVTVADLDSGYDPAHPDLQGVVVGTKDFLGGTITDGMGHGTHTAGIIAGSGAASAGKYRGVAPDAKLLIGKVCDASGSCPNSAIIAGMEWAAAQGVTAVNLSLGGGATDGTDPMSLALNNLTASTGTLFVVAAGNAGAARTVASPGSADAALTVGSVTKQDGLSPFSSRGPRVGDLAIKPDVAAPGSAIIAARAAGTSMGTPVDANYTSANGTSMATPHVTGAAAILAQQHPDWKAAQLKSALMSAGKPLAGLSIYDQGAGRLDIATATTRQVTVSPASLSFGFVKWPGGPERAKTITYHNDGDTPLTFALALDFTAPTGLFTLSAKEITVPAHGTADVTVTLRPGASIPEGQYGGRLVATSGQTVLSTPVGTTIEGERFGLTLTATGRDGNAPQFITGSVVDTATGSSVATLITAQPTTELRLPKGKYDIQAVLSEPYTPAGAGPRSLIALPEVNLEADATVALDARKASLVTNTVDGVGVKADYVDFGFDAGKSGVGYVADGTAGIYATPTKRVTDRKYVFHYMPALVPLTGTEIYRPVHWDSTGVPESLTYRDRVRDFAVVHADYGSQAPGSVGQRGIHAFYPGSWGGITPLRTLTLPVKRTEYYTPGKDVSWSNTLYYQELRPVVRYESETALRTTFDRRSYDIRWNQAPIGPSTGPVDLGWGLQRKGDKVTAYIPLFSASGKDTYTSSLNAKLTATTTATRDGQVLGTSAYPGYAQFTAPGAGVYTLTTSATRDLPWSVLGTSASATWTVHDPGADGAVPLLAVRYSGPDARAGWLYPLRLEVQRPVGSTVKRLELEVSYDEGKTWCRAPIFGSTAVLLHPATPGFVSLRATATDQLGNSVTQTTIRSYQTR